MEKKPFERPFIKKLQAGMPSKFGMKSQAEPITHIDNIPVPELISEHGSPLYVISEKTIRDNYIGCEFVEESGFTDRTLGFYLMK